MNQSILATAVDSRSLFEGLTRIGKIPLVILLHQVETLNYGIFNCAAPQHGDEHVVWVLEA